MRLISFAKSNDMNISSTFFLPMTTWNHPNNRSKTQIDHILIDTEHYDVIKNVCTQEGRIDIGSDHELVVA